MNDKFDLVYIDERSRESQLAVRAQALFNPDKIIWTKGAPHRHSAGALSATEFTRSKRNLYLTPFAGEFFKRCPGSRPGLACCNYFVLNWGQQCDMDCSYCYLQSFINFPFMTLYTNIDQAIEELHRLYSVMGHKPVRIGTGEVVDSLSLDLITQHAQRLTELFVNHFPNWTLEFKSKSAQIQGLMHTKAGRNVIVSWSVNPQSLIDSEERGTASLAERLTAAEVCAQAGYQIAFHIDPMIWHPRWQSNYQQLVTEIVSRFQPEQVAAVSIGALRFQPEQRHMMRERFGMQSWVTQAEVFSSRDGKLRYDQNLRSQMFQYVLNLFTQDSDEWKTFLCMETPESWLQTQQKSPFKIQKLHDLFDPSVVRAYDLSKS